MPKNVFYGNCTEENLIDFSLEVARFLSCGTIPERMIAIPLSKKRGSRRRIIGCKNGRPAPIKMDEMGVVFTASKIGFYPIGEVKMARWISESGNKIIFTRTNKGNSNFSFELFEEVPGSQYRGFLQRIGVDLTEVRP